MKNGKGVESENDKDPIWQSSRSFDRRDPDPGQLLIYRNGLM